MYVCVGGIDCVQLLVSIDECMHVDKSQTKTAIIWSGAN
jgi:hypothetical protein